MCSDELKVALLTVVIASSVIGVNSAFADTTKETSQNLSLPITVGVHNANRGGGDDSSNDGGPPPAVLDKHRSSSLMSHTGDSSDDGPPPAVRRNGESHNIEDLDWTTADNNTVPEKHMKGLSNCESTAAADGHLTLVEIMDCFYQVF